MESAKLRTFLEYRGELFFPQRLPLPHRCLSQTVSPEVNAESFPGPPSKRGQSIRWQPTGTVRFAIGSDAFDSWWWWATVSHVITIHFFFFIFHPLPPYSGKYTTSPSLGDCRTFELELGTCVRDWRTSLMVVRRANVQALTFTVLR